MVHLIGFRRRDMVLFGSFFLPFHSYQSSRLRSVPTPVGETQNYEFLIQATNITSCPGTCIRLVGLVFSDEETLFVSSDNSGGVSTHPS